MWPNNIMFYKYMHFYVNGFFKKKVWIVYFTDVKIRSWLSYGFPPFPALVIATSATTVCELGKQLVPHTYRVKGGWGAVGTQSSVTLQVHRNTCQSTGAWRMQARVSGSHGGGRGIDASFYSIILSPCLQHLRGLPWHAEAGLWGGKRG